MTWDETGEPARPVLREVAGRLEDLDERYQFQAFAKNATAAWIRCACAARWPNEMRSPARAERLNEGAERAMIDRLGAIILAPTDLVDEHELLGREPASPSRLTRRDPLL